MNQLEQILNNTEKIMQKLYQTQGTWTVWIPVISAVITAVLALIGIFYSTGHVKNNIRMNSRIEWIQRVRETAAGTISLCYLLVHEIEREKTQSALLKAQEKINLLILYFGPDEIKEEILEENSDIILDENTNEGKNNYIVIFLEKVLTDIDDYYKRKYCGEVQRLKFEIDNLKNKYPLVETGEMIANDEDGSLINIKNYPKEYFEEKNKLEEDLNKLQNSEEVLNDIKKIREILRIYLKIEWNIAKKGK